MTLIEGMARVLRKPNLSAEEKEALDRVIAIAKLVEDLGMALDDIGKQNASRKRLVPVLLAMGDQDLESLDRAL